ncbi:MAG: hypothetical protein ACTSWQ_09115 [Candidatus Thorarchaeota archaeon]
MNEDYIPRRISLAKLAKETKRELEKTAKKFDRLMKDWYHNDDDPDYYKYSAFFANTAGTIAETASDIAEDYPEV